MRDKALPRVPRPDGMPLPAGAARSISQGNRLALIAVRAGKTTPDTILTLLRVLYMTFFMSGSDCAADDIELLLTVETIFNNGILRAARGDGWQLPADQLRAIEQVVLLHERALAVVPQYRYRLACQRLEWFVHSRRVSPLPGSRLTPTGE